MQHSEPGRVDGRARLEIDEDRRAPPAHSRQQKRLEAGGGVGVELAPDDEDPDAVGRSFLLSDQEPRGPIQR
jgi:hypothetical protein